MTRAAEFTDDTIYDLAREGFLHELGVLVEITRSSWFRELQPAFLTYKACNYCGTNLTGDRLYKEQRASPAFGLNQYASYETLYCKLERNRLTRTD